jgi:hypothetical protein
MNSEVSIIGCKLAERKFKLSIYLKSQKRLWEKMYVFY